MIRPAIPEDADTLTVISFASKSVWQYPEAYFDVWRDELTVTPDYIRQHQVFVL